MKRKLISYLLVVGLIASMVPFSVFAEDGTTEATKVTTTVEQVTGAIDHAQKAEKDVADAAGEGTIADQENAAIDNQKDAQDNLNDALDVVDQANEGSEEQKENAQQAEDAADAAEAAKDEAGKQQNVAQGATTGAEEALEDVKNAGNKQDAVQAADKAEAQSDVANVAAEEAVAQYQVAVQKAAEAEAAYEAALKEAEEAQAEAERLYNEGLISAEEAAEMAADAAEAAEEARQAAEDAKEDAVAAAANVQATTNGTRTNLETAVADLENISSGDLTALQGKVSDLEQTISASEAQIVATQELLNQLTEDDAGYEDLVKALAAAQAAQKDANDRLTVAKRILAAKAEDEAKDHVLSQSTADRMKYYQSLLNVSSLSDNNKKELTKLVLENIGKYGEADLSGEVTFVTGKDTNGNDLLIFTIGEQTYEVVTVGQIGSRYLEYHITNFTDFETVKRLPNAWNTDTTKYQVTDKEGKEHSLTVKNNTYYVDNQKLVRDWNGDYYYKDGKNNVYVTIKDTTSPLYKTEADAMNTNSNSILAKWDEASKLLAQTDCVAGAIAAAAEGEYALADARVKEAAAKQAETKATNLKNDAVFAQAAAEAAYKAYQLLDQSVLAVDPQVVKEAKEAYEKAKAEADAAQKLADEAEAAAARAKRAAEEARKLADSFYVAPTKTEGQTIAEYAHALQGIVDEKLAAKVDGEMTNPVFVELVFEQYGYDIDLSDNTVEEVVKNGTRLEKTEVKSGDIVCILAEDGETVECFGIYYGNGIYVFHNQETGEVETAKTADIINDWFVVRVSK